MIDMKTRNAFAEGAKEEVSGQLELCGIFPGGKQFFGILWVSLCLTESMIIYLDVDAGLYFGCERVQQ